MATFSYKAITPDGTATEGKMNARDVFDLAAQLKASGNRLISSDEVEDKVPFYKRGLFGSVKVPEKVIFARNLSAMIGAGLSMSRALDVLKRQTKNQKFQIVLEDLGRDIKKGGTLSEGMKKHPKVFSPLFVSMVKAGEESGKVADSLLTVGTQIEKAYLIQRKVKGALVYPGIIISAMIIVGILMLIYVVPTLTSTFEELDVDLPASTQAIITVSDAFNNHLFLMLAGIVTFIISVFIAARTQRGKRAIDFAVLRIPVIGTLIQKTNAARTARTFSSLLDSGVEVVESLSIVEDVIQNSYYKDVLAKAGARIQKGEQISETFIAAEKLYPPLFSEMVAVGEETGQLSGMLSEIADFYEKEVEESTKNMTTIIEPILMVIVGVGVGFFAISMITPMYSLVSGI